MSKEFEGVFICQTEMEVDQEKGHGEKKERSKAESSETANKPENDVMKT